MKAKPPSQAAQRFTQWRQRRRLASWRGWPTSKWDPLTEVIDVAALGPFTEVGRHFITWPSNLVRDAGLAVVYENRQRARVWIVHSFGYELGGSLENGGEFVGTVVRASDPRAVALFLAWPSDIDSDPRGSDIIRRVWFDRSRDRVANVGQTVVLNADYTIDQVLARPKECYYADMHYAPSKVAGEWGQLLGCTIERFTADELTQEADRLAAGELAKLSAAKDEAWSITEAWMKEQGLW